jgi:hypothetical protein
MFAQLRDMLAAENSSIVPEENDHSRRGGPQRAEPHFAPVGIGENNFCESGAERLLHDASILVMASFTVKPRLTPASRWWQTPQFSDARRDIPCLHLSA